MNEEVDEQTFQDFSSQLDNVYQADDCGAYDSGMFMMQPMAQTLIHANRIICRSSFIKKPFLLMIWTSYLRKHDEIERKNLLIEHDNIIADGLSKEVFYVALNSELNVKPNVLAPGKYAIDVEPIPSRNRNNREVHLVYLRHLKERCTEVSLAEVLCYCLLQPKTVPIIHTRHEKTPYELVHNKKPDLTFFRIFGALCYPTNDSENLGKLQPTADIGIFVGYAPNRKGYRIYNKRTRQIMETIHVTFDELTEQMAPVQSSPGPAPNLLTPGPISSGLVPNPAPAIPYVPPTNKELEMLFQPMFDEYFNPPGIRQDPIPNVAQDPVIPTGPSVSIAIDLDAPSGSHTSSPLDHHSSSVHHGVAGEQYAEVNPFAAADPEPFVNVFAPDYNSEASSSGEITIPESNQSTLPHEHIRKWTDPCIF
ncbi:retrovirus-related pol polyprotein from transposon TNT 1-94 [Tanacetum coccineum]